MNASPNTEKVESVLSRSTEAEESDYSALLESISGLAGMLEAMHQQAVRHLLPIVNDILSSRSRDPQRIEHTLDALLDHAGYQPGLLLFKKLCRYYFEIDPAATVGYINAYREFYDSESEEEQV